MVLFLLLNGFIYQKVKMKEKKVTKNYILFTCYVYKNSIPGTGLRVPCVSSGKPPRDWVGTEGHLR